MTKSSNAAFAAALFTASVFGGSVAFANSYYQGVSPDQEHSREISAMRAKGIGTRVFTENMKNTSAGKVGPAHGDYYQGLDRRATSAR